GAVAVGLPCASGDELVSGWQPVGNWVASAANFPASLLPVGVTRQRAEESRRAVCAEKWPEAQADRIGSSTGRGRNHAPRRGGIFLLFLVGWRVVAPPGGAQRNKARSALADSWRPRGDRPIHHVAFGRACLASN